MTVRNLKRQFDYAIRESEAFGRSKRLDRLRGDVDVASRIYSYNTKFALKDFSRNFSAFMTERFPEVKEVKHISSEHAKAFLKQKEQEGCSKATLQTYRSDLNKMSLMVNNTYKCETKYIDDTIKDFKFEEAPTLRTAKMEKEDWEVIKADSYGSASGLGARACAAFGLRSSESVKLKLEDLVREDRIHIDKSKGGRSRDVPIQTDEQRQVVQELKAYAEQNGCSANERILGITADAQERWLAREFEKHNMNKYIEAKTSIHSLRKMYATEQYIKEYERLNDVEPKVRDDGRLEYDKNAWNIVSHNLGHGNDRTELFKAYVRG